MDREKLPIERALGVLWDVQSDTFKFKINMKEKPPTRRGLLSMVSSIYDPLGFVGPYVLLAKMLFQELCRRKVGWDDRMSQDVLDQWLRWLQDLPLLEQFSLPPCVRPPDFGTVVLCQLHHFSDASEKGYGAVTYLRMVDDLGGVYCCLLMSKSKLTPLKIKTIPRLELAVAVVSVKLEKLMRQQLEIPVHESLFWTDSMIVLNYIMNQDKRFHTFVANRVAAIQEVSQPSQWHHVDTSSNPADDVSRGMAAQDLVHSERWVKGPEFLWKAQDSWPQQPECFGKLADNDCEVKHASQVYATQTKDMYEENMVDQLFKYYDSWYKLKRAVAWLLRIKQLLHSRVQFTRSKTFLKASDPLTVTEIKQAEIAIVIYIQKDSFSEATKKSSSVRKLLPTMSACGVLCVRGRLGNTDLDTRTKHPWLLPSAHPVVDLIIRHYHEGTGHSGVEYVLGEIRQRYWIVKGHSTVKKVLGKCFDCRKRNAKPVPQQMADLPEDRVTPGKPPFTSVGVDYFGPLFVRRGRSDMKRYGCLFTCLVTRAIHIELAFSLDTDSFINALQRFTQSPWEPRADPVG